MKKNYMHTFANCFNQIWANHKRAQGEALRQQALREAAQPQHPITPAPVVRTNRPYVYPVIEQCMTYHTSWASKDISADMEAILSVLNSFQIPCCVEHVNQGPTLTQYMIRPAAGIRYDKILKLKKEFCGALNNNSARVYQDGSYVVIDVPGSANTVRVADILRNGNFYQNNGLTVAIGKRTDGSNMLADIGDMPHMLVAGTTGSGKSVFMQGLIVSLLLKHRPDELELYMVDPKMVEFSYYKPLRMCHVVTEIWKATELLNGLCNEMDSRYRQLAAAGVRDIGEYNQKAAVPMKRIVVFVDELADLIMTSKATVENCIVRLAQKARACGIHLVLATQRPTANVVTGLIKSNIPTKVCFSVPSYRDSMVMLDKAGAEMLLGNGDMLYKSKSSIETVRLQGGFIDSTEINNIVSVLMQNQ